MDDLDIISKLSLESGRDTKECRLFLNHIVEFIKESIESGTPVTIKGFGGWRLIDGNTKSIQFRISDKYKNALNKNIQTIN